MALPETDLRLEPIKLKLQLRHLEWEQRQVCGPEFPHLQTDGAGGLCSPSIFLVALSNKTGFRWYHHPLCSYPSPCPTTPGHLVTCCRHAVTMDAGMLLKWHSLTPGAEELVAITKPPSARPLSVTYTSLEIIYLLTLPAEDVMIG